MNKSILQLDIQDFINKNLKTDLKKLAFEKNPFTEIAFSEILNQIDNKAKAETKLPSFFGCKNIIYPSKTSLEQTSSEVTAKYKAGLVAGKSLVDVTGGFGVDDFYFAKKIEKVVHCEMNTDLHEIVKNNFRQLAVTNIECFCGDSHDFLEDSIAVFDWIYVDPSRRNNLKGKVFMLADCLPNVPYNLDFYFTKSQNIIIKTSPLLDISAGLQELKFVSEVHIIAVNNDVKELLWILKKNYQDKIQIKTVNINSTKNQYFDFVFDDVTTNILFDFPQKYLYEPNAAIMKSGAFNEVATQFKISKLNQNSHLYTADTLINFSGRVFEILQNFDYSKANMTSFLANKKANITVRNFTETVESIRKKWKIKDGGDLYCFFTTDLKNKKIVLVCKKIL